ncbi:MAG TPA: hypothetical protein P5329_09280, partial [Candidatus Competibacteraceae bacterium]|nr:hypothetical protein [Candidatus Competibacteraceae bacterium]
ADHGCRGGQKAASAEIDGTYRTHKQSPDYRFIVDIKRVGSPEGVTVALEPDHAPPPGQKWGLLQNPLR